MIQDVFIIGATGKVGRTLIRQILEKDTDPNTHKNPTRIVGLASSKNFIYEREGLTQENIEHFLAYPGFGESFGLWKILERVDYKPLWGVFKQRERSISFIDVTADGLNMLPFHKKIIFNSKHRVVTANKLPLVLVDSYNFQYLTGQVNRYGFRCSVMAGAEAVSKVRDLKDLGDVPFEISGCFSGTLGYIISELESGRKFSEIVKEAKELGYTEPNPADDLNGLDVARKIFILARTAGYCVGDPNMIIEPFVASQFLKEENSEKLIKGLQELDIGFSEQIKRAADKGRALRYVASLFLRNDQPFIKVGLREVSKDSPLGVLKGTSNKIVIKTKTHGDNCYCVEAPGAGLEITAQNIRRDLLGQLAERIVNYKTA